MSRFLWERFTADGQLNSEFNTGGVLAALRRGRNQEPGRAPELWQYYTQLNDRGALTRAVRAEHTCLVTYGVHQQGVTYPAHVPDVELGRTLAALRNSGKFSTEAVDRHVTQLATADQWPELSHHLMALVNLIKATKRPSGFNYTRLFHDLVDLHDESRASRVRRRWGAEYFAPSTENNERKEGE